MVKKLNNMERNITITLEKAKEWYSSGNNQLKEIALQAFSKDELLPSFKDITTFKKACEALNLHYEVTSIISKDIAMTDKASAAMFELNIVRKALNLGQDLHLTEGNIWYPINPFLAEDATHFRNKLKEHEIEVVGKIKNEGEIYEVIGGLADVNDDDGLGDFCHVVKVGFTTASSGFLGCASEEIAQHFSKYFGMLIIKAMYADMVDFKIIENKYQ